MSVPNWIRNRISASEIIETMIYGDIYVYSDKAENQTNSCLKNNEVNIR